MSNINTVSGATIAIGSTDDAANQAQFEADSYVEIGSVEDLGEYGDQNEVVKFTSIADARTQKLKGTADAGDLALVVGADADNEGQAALAAAQAVKHAYNFRVTYDDAITLNGTGSVEYFRGLVMSKRRQSGTANNVLRRQFMIAITTAIVEVPAT